MRKKRTMKSPARYVPTAKIRNRSSAHYKRACRRKGATSCKQRVITFPQQEKVAAAMSFPKAAADASLQKTDKGDLILLRGCENTSLELQKLLQAAADVVKDFGGDVKVEFPRYRCLSCKQYFPLASYRKDNFANHLKKDRRRGSGSLKRWFAGRGGATKKPKRVPRSTTRSISPSVICEGFWRRTSPMTCTDITGHYYATHRDWYGEPRHRTMMLLEDGTSRSYVGTYRSTRCLKLAINIDNTPTGTMTCNQCARVPTLPSFLAVTQRLPCPPAVHTPNKFLSREDLVQKLVTVNQAVRNLRKKVVRNLQRTRTQAAKEALRRDDVAKFCKELQYIAQRGTLEDKKMMWSYLQDVVRCEYLKKKSGPNGALGMRWSADTKDLASSQKLMAGKRLPQHLRENIGGPSKRTINRHLKSVRKTVWPGSPGVAANMEAVREIWGPIILARRRQQHESNRPLRVPVDDGEEDEDELPVDDGEEDEDELPELVHEDDDDDDEDADVVMVEMSEDESGILGRIEYWRERDSIYGSCGWKSPGHKCDDHFHPVIGDSWDRLVEMMKKAVVASYVRVIMLNPLCDWLPPMTVHMNATCNKFDHHPHVTSQWSNTLKEFNRCLRPLGCNHTGRGSDGDARRFKIQYEMMMLAMEELERRRRVTVSLQLIWRRQPCFAWVVSQIVRRIRGTRRPWVPRPVTRRPASYTLPISLEGAKGFTFAARATYDSKTGKMLAITDLSTQDTKHKAKRLDMPLQSAAKTMLLGRYVASAIDLFLVRTFFNDEQVRHLRISDLKRDDRQNFAAVVRRSGKLVVGILEMLQAPEHGGHLTHGTAAVYRMISKYLLLFFSQKLALVDRVENAAYVCQFLRLWHVSIRSWPDQEERNCQDNFYPFQTFRQVLLSCMSAVTFILGCSVLTPTQFCGLMFLGSDCCEVLFSMFGGWGQITSWQRNFTIKGAAEKARDVNALMTMRARGNVQQQTHRNAKAGEFQNKLHEDMTLEDADLSSYPSVAEMIDAWHRGQSEATAVCLGLGLKHRDISDAMWSRPWEHDPPNPRVTAIDDYLRRKFMGSDSDSDSDSEHDDSAGDDDVPGLVPLDEDDMLPRVQIGYAMNLIRRDVEGDGNNDTSDEVPTHMIKTPSGRLISKVTAVCMLREAFDDNGVISKDRLTRIQQCAQRARMDVTALSEHDEDLQLELHKDVAVAFETGAGEPLKLWFGRVQKMVVLSQTGRRSLRLGSIPLDKLPDGLSIMCNYYDKIPRRTRAYRYVPKCAEPKFYPASSIICVVQFDYDIDSQTYKLSLEQWQHIQLELQRLAQSR